MTIDAADRIPILLYHSLGTQVRPSYRRFAIDPGLFRAQMEYIADAALATTTISGLVNRGFTDRRTVAITFDDGFRDLVEVALPILRTLNLAATVYVVTGHIGGTSRWLEREGEGKRPLLSWAEIRDLAAEGFEIGAHGHRHLALDVMPERAAAEEISRSRQVLQDGLGGPVASFAYPYGFHSAATKRLVASEGFTSACGVRQALSHRREDPYAIARIMVGPRTPMNEFQAWIQGRGSLPTSWPGERLRTRLWRTVRRFRSRSAA